MIGWGNNTLRGGQTAFHGIRMWAQMFRIALFVAAGMAVAVPVWNIWRNTTGYEWYAAGMYTLVEGKLTIGFKGTSLQEIKDPYGRGACVPAGLYLQLVLGLVFPRASARRNLLGALGSARNLARASSRASSSGSGSWAAALDEESTYAALNWSRPGNCAALCSPCILGFCNTSRPQRASRPTVSPACPIRSAPRPSTPSSRVPREQGKPC